MKFLKKLFTFAIAFAMLFSLGTRVMAADDDEEPEVETSAYDETLTISGLTSGDTVRFFKLVQWVGDEETVPADAVKGWQAIAPMTKDQLKSILGAPAVPAVVDPETGEVITPEVPAVVAEGITSELAGQLAVAFKAVTPVTTINAEGSTVEFKVTEDSDPDTEGVQPYGPGIYMALITPADANTVYNPVFVSSDFNTDNPGNVAVNEAATYSDSAAAKKSTLNVIKTTSNVDFTEAVGNKVNFTVETTIPGYGEIYEHPKFDVNDKLTALTLVENSVKITAPADLPADAYTITEGTDSYKIVFAETYLKTVKIPTAVKIEYSALVTTDAIYAVNEEKNEVYVEYSHDPSNQSDYEVKKDTTQHFTFSIDAQGAGIGQEVSGKKTSEVVKVGVDAAGEPITGVTETSAITSTETWESPLAGAVFGLFTDKDCKNPYYPKDPETGEVTDTALTAESKEDGRMNFKGLDEGTYYLKEISAPAGFVKDSKVHEVVITAETEAVEITEWWNGSAWVSEKPTTGTAKEVTYTTDVLKSYTVTIDGELTATYTFKNVNPTTNINWEEAVLVEHPFELVNTQGTELPSTGGMGTTLFYTIGGMLVIGAGILLVSRRRMAE